MIDYVIYKTDTGEILKTGSCPESSFSVKSVGAGESILQAIASDALHYVKDGEIREKGTPPSNLHTFDFSTEQWALDETLAARVNRRDRLMLLQSSDWTQMADSPLTDAKKTEWATYRQALRDLPNQAGFPSTITWPTEPS